MRIFTKAIANKEQILARKNITTEGIEILLLQRDFSNSELTDLLSLCSDNFGTVNLEAPFDIDDSALDLLNQKHRGYLETALELLNKIPNHGFLTTHLVGKSQIITPPYQEDLDRQNKEEILQECLNYIVTLDPQNQLIALENTFPTDWADEDIGKINFYLIGKISSDFGDRIRTFDIGHSGITAFTYKNLDSLHAYPFKFGLVPVYFSKEEQKVAKTAKKSLTNVVCKEIQKGKIVNVHVNVNWDLQDGYGTRGPTTLDLLQILEQLKGKDATLVTEVKERETGDYLGVPNQKEMFDYLKKLFY